MHRYLFLKFTNIFSIDLIIYKLSFKIFIWSSKNIILNLILIFYYYFFHFYIFYYGYLYNNFYIIFLKYSNTNNSYSTLDANVPNIFTKSSPLYWFIKNKRRNINKFLSILELFNLNYLLTSLLLIFKFPFVNPLIKPLPP